MLVIFYGDLFFFYASLKLKSLMKRLFNWKYVSELNLDFFFFLNCFEPHQKWKQTRKDSWYYVPLMFSDMYVYLIYNIFKLCLI